MKYIISMSDHVVDKGIVREIEAPSVFDAIDLVTAVLDHPEDTELIEAVPVFE